MYAKLLNRSRKSDENHLDEQLKAQRHAVDRMVPRYRSLGEILLDPGIEDADLRTRLFAVVSETELREDHADLAHGRRGDRRARFEDMTARHSALSRFAAPFLARMDFLNESGARASPTLRALRAYPHGPRARDVEPA